MVIRKSAVIKKRAARPRKSQKVRKPDFSWKPSPADRREGRRLAREERQHQRRLAKAIQQLREILPIYIRCHYGDPTTGRRPVILNAPVIARLNAAATLCALLAEGSTP
jgi:hypothetical protein